MVMTNAVVNIDMAAAWDGDEGDDWARDWKHYDRSVGGYHQLLLVAADIGTSDRALDVGCGNGESTRDAARAAVDGSALGVDLSSRMILRARELARLEGVDNVSFEQADAQVRSFGTTFDVVLSRFGTMFFIDPIAAFANIGSALRPDGRLATVAWRGVVDNEWLQCVLGALAIGRELPVPPAGAPGPFGLADPDATRATLVAAGFADIDVEPVDQPFWAGNDGDDAFDFFRNTGVVRGMTQELDDAQRARALEALRTTMVEHETADGVCFGSGSWLVTARRPVR